MSTASGIPGGSSDQGEVHTETPQPIDLAHAHGHSPIHSHVLRAGNPGGPILGLRPVRTYLATAGSLSVGGKTGTGVSLPHVVAASHPSIVVNRTVQNLAILPRAAVTAVNPVSVSSGTPSGTGSPIATLQFTRNTLMASNVRPSLTSAAVLTGGTTSIAVNPISPAGFSSIRLTPASTVNNGSWIQAGGTPGSGSIRQTTIQVMNRAIRPDSGKIIHIPQSGAVQHLTQIQVLDKNSILKPATPISVRGALPQSSCTPSAIALGSITPITIRTTSLPVASSTSAQQKVITQPAHGPPIIVNAGPQKFTQIQNFTPVSRIPVISLSAANGGNTVISGTNSIIGVNTRPSSTPNLIMSPTSTSTQLPKMYPLSRDVSTTLVETYINQGHVQVQPTQNHISSPTLTVVTNSNSPYNSSPSPLRPTFVITSTSNNSTSGIYAAGALKGSTPHQLIQVQAPLSLHSTGGGGTSTAVLPNYYVEQKNLQTNVSVFPHSSTPPVPKRVELINEKRNEKGSSLVTSGGGIILNTTSTGPPSDSGVGCGLSAHFSHPIPVQTATSAIVHPITLTKDSPLVTSNSQQQTSSVNPQHSNMISAAALITVTTTTSTPTSLTTTNTSIVTLTLGGIGSGGSTAISTITTSTTISPTQSIPHTANISTSNPSSSPATSTAAQSPIQSKATLSPRPSILRKREAGGCETNFIPLRAQRNLTVNFSGTGSATPTTTSGSNAGTNTSNNGPSTSSITPGVLISTVSSNKENNSLGSTFSTFGGLSSSSTSTSSACIQVGVSILKKEFQPPTEESSWQSCSSNSSSGSTTLSATSDTAEGSMETSSFTMLIPTTSSSHAVISSSSCSLNSTTLPSYIITRPINSSLPMVTPIRQNGIMVRPRAPLPTSILSGLPSSIAIVNNPPSIRHRATAAGKGRDAKGRNRDVVSPRKKPRKQQLTSTGFVDASSPEFSFYQAKRFKRAGESAGKAGDEIQECGGTVTGVSMTTCQQAQPPIQLEPKQPRRVLYLMKKPRASLLQTNSFKPNPRNSHYLQYTDVKAKDERRPTISDLANQKNVLHKVEGWKLKHLTTQMDNVIDYEGRVVQQFSRLLSGLSSDGCLNSCPSPNSSRDASRIEDLLKGNLQRCKVLRDQMTESKIQLSKVFDHRPRILDVINKHISKRLTASTGVTLTTSNTVATCTKKRDKS